jgi:hypothetical protein
VRPNSSPFQPRLPGFSEASPISHSVETAVLCLSERALILRPNHSVLLPPIDRALLDELFSMRNMLEGEAARRGALTLKDEDFAELEAPIDVTRIHYVRGGHVQERVIAIQTIATILANRCGSEILAEQILNLRVRTAPFSAAGASDAPSDCEAPPRPSNRSYRRPGPKGRKCPLRHRILFNDFYGIADSQNALNGINFRTTRAMTSAPLAVS